MVARAARASAAAAAAAEDGSIAAEAARVRTSQRQAGGRRIITVYFHIVTHAGQGGVYIYQIDRQMSVSKACTARCTPAAL
jgi:hypothetical protein